MSDTVIYWRYTTSELHITYTLYDSTISRKVRRRAKSEREKAKLARCKSETRAKREVIAVETHTDVHTAESYYIPAYTVHIRAN